VHLTIIPTWARCRAFGDCVLAINAKLVADPRGGSGNWAENVLRFQTHSARPEPEHLALVSAHIFQRGWRE